MRCFNPFTKKLLTLALSINLRRGGMSLRSSGGHLLHQYCTDWSPQCLERAQKCTQHPRYTPFRATPSLSQMGSSVPVDLRRTLAWPYTICLYHAAQLGSLGLLVIAFLAALQSNNNVGFQATFAVVCLIPIQTFQHWWRGSQTLLEATRVIRVCQTESTTHWLFLATRSFWCTPFTCRYHFIKLLKPLAVFELYVVPSSQALHCHFWNRWDRCLPMWNLWSVTWPFTTKILLHLLGFNVILDRL